MLSPKNVLVAAANREDENLRFRAFLKNRANPNELDQQFLELHKELFAKYDCCRCGNCCRAYSTTLTEEEIVIISTYLGLTRQKFLEDHLILGCQHQPKNVDFRQKMSVFGGRHSSVYSPFPQLHLPA